MTLKQNCLHFGVCPKQRMYFKGFCCPKLGQGFKPSAALLYLNIGRVLPPPLPNPGVPHVSHTNDTWFFKAGLRFTTTWQVHHVNFFFVNFAWKKSSVRSIGKRFCFCPLYILSLPQIMKKLCWCHSNIIFEEAWRYVFAPLVVTQCWGDCSCLGPKGEIDVSTD